MSGSHDAALDTLFEESRALHRAGRLAEAEAGYRQLLAAAPAHAKARHLFGTLLHQMGHTAAAIAEIERAIVQQPGTPAMLINLGGAYLGAGRAADAACACREAIQLSPDAAQAHFNLGLALRELDDWKGATDAYETYIRLKPADAAGYGALGDTLKERGHYDAAMVAFEMALTYAPEHTGIHIGMADLFARKGWGQAALVLLERAAEIAPDDPQVRRRAAEQKLRAGDLAGGWPAYDEHRLANTDIPSRPAPLAYWRGEDLSGKSILVWNEQGVGDETLYASILPDVISRAARCAIACSMRMAPIFTRSFPLADVRAWDGVQSPLRGDETFDFQIAIGSLGRYLRTDFADFPRHTGYLKADPDKKAHLRRTYETLAQGRRIVGLAWKSKNRVLGSSKSASLMRFGPILQTPGVMFVNLQYGDVAAEIAEARAAFGADVHEDAAVDPLRDLDGFFAQTAAMDLVIATSNSAAHAAGALDVPTWLLLPEGRGALWYWFLGREDSPWYPSLRLLRAGPATPDESWETAPAVRAGRDLATWAAAPRAES